MIAAPLVLSNLIYPAGALGVAVFISAIYVLWRRRPQSVEDHMASFTKRLQALEALTPERDESDGSKPSRTNGKSVFPNGRGSARWDRRRPAMAPPRSVRTSEGSNRPAGSSGG